MKTDVSYEWTLHEVDEDGDIIDHHFAEDLEWFLSRSKYRDNLANALAGSKKWQIELWRNRGNEDDGLVCRSYAYYSSDEGLAKEFDLNCTRDRNSGGPKVPAKFFKQIDAAIKSLKITA